MNVRAVTPEIMRLRLEGDHTLEECYVVWNPEIGQWQAYDDDGRQMFAEDREVAALKLFARRLYYKQRRNRIPEDRAPVAADRAILGTVAGILILLVSLALFVDGAIDVFSRLV